MHASEDQDFLLLLLIELLRLGCLLSLIRMYANDAEVSRDRLLEFVKCIAHAIFLAGGFLFLRASGETDDSRVNIIPC